MKGMILDYSIQQNQGVISGDDGNRYTFTGTEWKENTAPYKGQRVDFETQMAGQATQIYAEVRGSVQLQKAPISREQYQEEEEYGFFDWGLKPFKQYADFNGRARRKEFWFFHLFTILIGLVIGFMAGLLGMSPNVSNTIQGILNIALLIPTLAVSARRLHDINKSGWWILIAFTIIGLIPLIIWYATETKPEDNEWGSPAK